MLERAQGWWRLAREVKSRGLGRFDTLASKHMLPLLAIGSSVGGALAHDDRRPAAIAARLNRGMLDSGLSIPVRSLVYKEIPLRFRGHMRWLLEGFVISLRMSAAGLLPLLAGRPDPLWLCGLGALTTVLHLLASGRVRRSSRGAARSSCSSARRSGASRRAGPRGARPRRGARR
jgi:hypothetical protein